MSKNFCLTNFFCVDPYVFTIIVGGLILGFMYMDTLLKEQTRKMFLKLKTEMKNDNQENNNKNSLFNKYYDRIYDLLSPPVRDYTPQYPSVHVSGQELPTFQQVGLVYRSETDPNYNPEDTNRFSLYGRPRFYGSSKFEYYVIANGIKISIGDNMNELYSGDTVNITGFSGDFITEIYETEGPRYNPWG